VYLQASLVIDDRSDRSLDEVGTSRRTLVERYPEGSIMNLTEVRVALRDDEKLKAFVTLTLDNCFVIRGLKIIRGNRGTFVAFPSRRKPDGAYQDICHPINGATRRWMEQAILAKYQEALEKTPVQ
jgi:stage V sporulation protein G